MIPARHAKLHRLSPPESALTETLARQCPSCQSKQIVHAIGAEGMLKSEQRCDACGTGFWFVRERIT
jgi:uncharacterized protein (DUF983 family)